MRIVEEAPADNEGFFQQVLLASDDELLFLGFVLILGLLALNRIIIDTKAMVSEIQDNPDTHIPLPRFLTFRR